MKTLFTLVVIVSLLIAAPAWASINLNSSRSNVYRIQGQSQNYIIVTGSSEIASPDQVKALLAALDKLGPNVDEWFLGRWLSSNLGRFGIDRSRIKKQILRRCGIGMKVWAVIFLSDSNDEAAAIAVGDSLSVTRPVVHINK